MKISQLTPRFLPSRGGLEWCVYETSKYLTNKGHQVKVFTSNLTERSSHYLKKTEVINGINVKRSNAFPLLPIQGGIMNIMPNMFFDVIFDKSDIYHTYGVGSFPTLMGSLKHMSGNKVVLSVMSDMRRGLISQKIIDRATMKILKSADQLIVLTNEEKNYLINTSGLKDREIQVIPPGINLERFSNCYIDPYEFREKYHLKKYVIFFAGRINISHKGLDTLVKALAILKNDFEVSCVMCGDDWGSKNTLKQLAKNLNVHEYLKFFDPNDQKFLGEAYGAADVFVLPSNFEVFGMVLVEAMASGTPVIGSKVGGIVDVISNGETGFTVPPNDPKSLAEAISEILGNKRKREIMGQNAKTSASKYSSEVIGEKILKLYQKILEKNIS